jgi:hypothetical protein
VADRRIGRIAKLLGKKQVRKAVEEAEREFDAAAEAEAKAAALFEGYEICAGCGLTLRNGTDIHGFYHHGEGGCGNSDEAHAVREICPHEIASTTSELARGPKTSPVFRKSKRKFRLKWSHAMGAL